MRLIYDREKGETEESYGQELASHPGLGPYADDGNIVGVASARGKDRRDDELRDHLFVRRPCAVRGKATLGAAIGRRGTGARKGSQACLLTA